MIAPSAVEDTDEKLLADLLNSDLRCGDSLYGSSDEEEESPKSFRIPKKDRSLQNQYLGTDENRKLPEPSRIEQHRDLREQLTQKEYLKRTAEESGAIAVGVRNGEVEVQEPYNVLQRPNQANNDSMVYPENVNPPHNFPNELYRR